ncbi:MAG: CDP-alcohol phosphatidyltransferase family protein [Proteobacteria bacterium]|nr:CDP-alcohol phosphatidyltransferase family protein [Pseudomonadota bacterium]
MTVLVKKPKEITEWLNRFFIHPLSYFLVGHIKKTAILPNHLSFLGVLSSLVAAFCLYQAYYSGFFFILSLMFFGLRMIFDAADGQLARAKNLCSENGAIIDGICDYFSFFFIYSAIGYLYYPLYGAAIFLFIALTALSNALQASSYQLYLDLYNFVQYRKIGDKLKFITSDKPKGFSILLAIYNRLQLCFLKEESILSLVKEEPHNKSASFKQLLPKWHLLALNYRYLLLSLLIKHIMVYFFIEIVLLNFVLGWLLVRTERLLYKI